MAMRKLLNAIERAGNILPDPASLFLLAAVAVFLMSAVAAGLGWESRLLDLEGEVVLSATPVNLLSASGFRWLFENMTRLFIEFRPLGLVLVVALGIAVAERSGFISALLRTLLYCVPNRLLTPATFFTGIMASVALDAGYIVLPPLAALIFKAAGRSPLLGISAVFAGVASGFGANLVLTAADPMLAGITQEAARIIDPRYHVNPACNLYLMFISTIVLTVIGWMVADWVVEPRLNALPESEGGPPSEQKAGSGFGEPGEKKALLLALAALFVTFMLMVVNVVFPWGFLYDAPESRGVMATWVIVMVPLLFVLFLVPGLVFGISAGSIKSDRDVIKMMSEYVSLLGNYIVLVFFAAIFIGTFEYSGLGLMLAIEGGGLLKRAAFSQSFLLIGFIMVVALINIFVGSMSAKWALLASVFVPMLMTVGISPELTQAAYRIGDSATNSITPLNPYLIVILVFVQQHAKGAGIGTIISLMLPYALIFLVLWTLLLVAWLGLGLPLGVMS